MVKAMKRRPGAEVARAKKKERKVKMGTLFLLVLLVLGFSVAGYWGFSPRGGQEEEPQPQGEQYEFGTGTLSGTMEGTMGELTGARAVFGQLDVPFDLSKRLEGELYLLDDGMSQLIFTDAGKDEIEDAAGGDYIIYTIASCGEFDCLVEEAPNGSMLFDVYRLNQTSGFLQTMEIGFPTAAAAIEL